MCDRFFVCLFVCLFFVCFFVVVVFFAYARASTSSPNSAVRHFHQIYIDILLLPTISVWTVSFRYFGQLWRELVKGVFVDLDV